MNWHFIRSNIEVTIASLVPFNYTAFYATDRRNLFAVISFSDGVDHSYLSNLLVRQRLRRNVYRTCVYRCRFTFVSNDLSTLSCQNKSSKHYVKTLYGYAPNGMTRHIVKVQGCHSLTDTRRETELGVRFFFLTIRDWTTPWRVKSRIRFHG